MSIISPTERLINEGHMISLVQDGYGCRDTRKAVALLSLKRQVYALLALEAVHKYPALVFKAIMEGWSETKLLAEIRKKFKAQQLM